MDHRNKWGEEVAHQTMEGEEEFDKLCKAFFDKNIPTTVSSQNGFP